jgi:hypothetical protein
VETIVAIPGVPSTSQAPNPLFNYEFFKYNKEDDTYTCPAGQVLRTNGSRGTGSGQAVEASAGLNSTRQSHAGNVRSAFYAIFTFFRRKISRLEELIYQNVIDHWKIQQSPKSL